MDVFCQVTDKKPISFTDSLPQAGIDSMATVEFMELLGDELGPAAAKQLTPTLMYDYATTEALAEYLSRSVVSSNFVGSSLKTVPSIDSLKASIMDVFCQVTDKKPISFTDSLPQAGVDSMATVEFMELLGDKLGPAAAKQLTPTIMYDYATPEALAEYLSQSSDNSEEWSSEVSSDAGSLTLTLTSPPPSFGSCSTRSHLCSS